MKIEGMQYPLSPQRVLSRGNDSAPSANAAEDAVYFEPDEQRRENQRQPQSQEHQDQPAHQELAASVEIHAALEPGGEPTPGAIDGALIKKPTPRIVDVLA